MATAEALAAGEKSERRLALRVWLLTALVFVAASVVPTGGLFRGRGYADIDLYGSYADAVFSGQVLYRDVFVEYPPGAFAVLLPPAIFPAEEYRFLFKLLMMLVALGGLYCATRFLVVAGAASRRLGVAVLALALSPLLLGSVWLNTYDPWPAVLTVATLLAVVSGYAVAGFVCLALAFTAKVYALVLLPPAVLYVVRRSGRRAAARAVGVFCAVSAIVVVPFAALAPGGLWESFESQAGRGLHVESLGAGLLLAADRLGLYDATVAYGDTAARSRDLAGTLPDALAVVGSIASLLAAAAVWVLYARGAPSRERLAAAFAASVAGFVVFGKVLSPQYAEWLLFLVPLVAGLEGLLASALFGLALLFAELWFHRYRELYAVGDLVWLVLLRDLALAGCYLWLLSRLRTTTPSRWNTTRQLRFRRRLRSAVAAGSGEKASR